MNRITMSFFVGTLICRTTLTASQDERNLRMIRGMAFVSRMRISQYPGMVHATYPR